MAMKDWQQAATVHAPLHAAAPAGEAMGCEKCHGWVEHDLSMAHLGNPAVSPQPFHSHMCRMCARKRVRAKATMCTEASEHDALNAAAAGIAMAVTNCKNI